MLGHGKDICCPVRDQRIEDRRSIAIARGDEADERGVRLGESGGEAGHVEDFIFPP